MKLTLGAFIAALRKEKGLTQRELSEMLCVSDKTVSHWERDETSPDISLLPVIADIFGITVDELLKGEKKRETNGEEKTEKEENKEKYTGILYALDIAFNRFRTRNFFSIATSVIAVLCGCITDYFKTIEVGYLVFIAVLTISFLLTALFRGGFTSNLVSPYADKETLKEYEKRANRITLCSLYFSFICFILYSSRVILYIAGVALVLLILLASGVLILLCEKALRKKDLVSFSDKPLIIKKKNLIKVFSCLLCVLMLFTVYLSYMSTDETDIMYEKAEYTLVSETDFVSLMEKDIPAPDEIYGRRDGRWEHTELLPSDKGTEYTFYPDFGADSTSIMIIDPDGDGEVTFTYNNLEIARYSYNADEGFRVYTHAQLIEARAKAEKEYSFFTVVHLALCPATVLICVGIYFILKRFLLGKGRSENIVLKGF